MTSVIVDRHQLVRDLSAMIRCPSVNSFGAPTVTGAEAAMADLYERQMRELGLEIGTQEVTNGRRNVWGRLKGSGGGPTILLAGHLDTVGIDGYDAPFEPIIQDGRIYGRGSCDMKAGLAAYLEVIRHFKRSGTKPYGDVIVAGVIDEEHAMTGSRAFGQSGPKVDYAIVAEPTNLQISTAHKGQVLTTIKTNGLAAHSSTPTAGRNAIYHMAHVLRALEAYAAEVAKRAPDKVCGSPSFSVGVIKGGDNACTVPDYCEIDIDRRTIPSESTAQVMDELHVLIDSAKRDMPDLDCAISTPFLDLPPLDTALDAPITKAIKAACQAELGSVEITAFPGSTDAPNFGCLTVICGAGELAQCHSLDEYVALNQIEAAVRIYVNTIFAMQTER